MNQRGGQVPANSRYNASPVSIPNQQLTSSIDWDAVDFGRNTHLDSIAFHNGGGGNNNYNVTDDQFHDMSLTSLAKRLDKDADSIRRFNTTNATEFGNTTMASRMSAISLVGGNRSIGEYFKARSQLPPLRDDGNINFAALELRTKQPETSTRESLTSFFMGSKSEGQGSEQMINQVMKYCMGKERESTAVPTAIANKNYAKTEDYTRKTPPNKEKDDTLTVGIMDITAISNITSIGSIPSSPPHSTPKRQSKNSNGSNGVIYGHRLSLRDMRSSGVFQGGNAVDPKPKFSDASSATSFVDSYREREKMLQQDRKQDSVVPRLSVKDERNVSPNSSISSSATSASAATQCQLQIYGAQHPHSVMSVPSSHNIPIVIQVQCPCSNHGGTGVRQTNVGCSQTAAQPQYYGSTTTCHHPPLHQQQHVVPQMVPMMAMPVMMPVMSQSSCLNHQVPVQYQPAPNTQCQCRCASSVN